ncbi:LLM class F420-dependent oxidoreductase [Actinomadura sp. NBRC 104412]|uniref:LLM class F420-dependent oxidoreductase n=1 Tax=Actinomadura sp. NBRC 104412 TaxID=3032203 RepID=UPI0024A139B5|nr:LLM class F420-dependent oxidoreductase [Actinomadura sp. NBRC 104412]GLZ09194.1 LLM class F420-dependent oxidoreductase [Actinomadura sp. NBRC 104412]
MTAIRWAVNLPLPGRALRDHREVIEALPGLGYADVWTGEGGGIDAFTPLAAAAAWRPDLGVGTGVVPVSTRGPAVLAQTAAALSELAAERVMLGLGTSVPAHVTALNGIPFAKPVARLRDTVRFLKTALRGDPVDEEYETFTVRGYRPPPLAAVPPKIIVGALRPRMVRLGLTEGDGVITNVLAAGDLERVLAEAGPLPLDKEFVVKLFVCPTEDTAHARRTGRAFLGWILNQAPYRAFHDWLGHGDRLTESRTLYDSGHGAAAGLALPDDIVDALWIHGSLDECRQRIARFAQPGVTSILLFVAPTPELLKSHHTLPNLLAHLHPSPQTNNPTR